jgi:hypothetical protein
MRSGVRSPSAPQLKTFAFVVLVAGTACNTSSPAKDVPRDAVDADALPANAAASSLPATSGAASALPSAAASSLPAPSAAVSAPSVSACASDADCRTWSSYCQDAPCVCRVFAKGEPDVRCSGAGSVACFADPCMNKTAACQGGRCVLVMGSRL